jgi:hypothetical protein
MVRSVWIKTVGALLVGTGLVCGQQPASAQGTPPGSGEEIISIQEAGKPEQKCKLLRNWTTPQGHLAHEVKLLGTGELIILVEGMPVTSPGGGQALATQMYHQGRDGSWPPGTPAPPTQPAPSTPSVQRTQYTSPTPTPYAAAQPTVRNVPVPGSSTMPYTPTPSTQGLPVIISEAPEEHPGLGSRVKDMASHLFHRDQTESMPVIVQGGPMPMMTTTTPGSVTQITEIPESRPPLGSRVKGFASRLLGRDQGETVTIVEGPPVMGATPAQPFAGSVPATRAPSVAGSASATPAPTPIQKVSVPPAVSTTTTPANAKLAPVAAAPAPANARAWPSAYAGQPGGGTGTSYADNPIMSMSPPGAGTPAQKNRLVPTATNPCTECQPSGTPVMRPAVASAPCPCTSCQPTGPVIVQGTMPHTAPTSPGLRDRLATLFNKNGSSDTMVTTTSVPTPPPMITTTTTTVPTPPAVAATAPVPPKKVPVEPAKVTDWRQSWGTPKTEVVSTPKPDGPMAETVNVPSKRSTPAAPLVTASVPTKPIAPVPPPFVAPTAPAPKMDVAMKPAGPPAADTKRPDPLKDPETYLHPMAENKAMVRPVEDRTARADLTMADGSRSSKAPLGTQSVMEAGSPQYVPVPIVTVPDYRRVPQPPPAQVPQAPEPNRFDPTNAFTNPAPAPAQSPSPAAQVPVVANAFTAPPAPVDPTVSAGGAFGGMPQGYPVVGMYPPGYGPRMPMYPPAGYNPMTRGMYPPVPYGPTGQASYPMNPAAMGQAGYPMNPAAMSQPVRPVSYQVAMANPARPGAPGMSSGPAGMPSEAIATLRDSIYPSQREWAATTLAGCDSRSQPDAVHALLTGAREDPAPTVRAACVRGLVKMKANTGPVITALQALKTDGDPRVLHEVEAALATLTQERMSR